MVSKWSHKWIGLVPPQALLHLRTLNLVAPAAKPVTRLAGQEVPAYLVSGFAAEIKNQTDLLQQPF